MLIAPARDDEFFFCICVYLWLNALLVLFLISVNLRLSVAQSSFDF